MFQIDNHRNVERLQETKTSAMEESTDTEETSRPVVDRAAVAGHHGVRDGLFQVDGTARRVQHRHQVQTVFHFGATVDFRLQTRVSRSHIVFVRYLYRS